MWFKVENREHSVKIEPTILVTDLRQACLTIATPQCAPIIDMYILRYSVCLCVSKKLLQSHWSDFNDS